MINGFPNYPIINTAFQLNQCGGIIYGYSKENVATDRILGNKMLKSTS